ncbi:hypothetical protein ACIBSR_27025 [Streptomyces sp. NPDC049936]
MAVSSTSSAPPSHSPLVRGLTTTPADGTWARGAARHLDDLGPAPRWC